MRKKGKSGMFDAQDLEKARQRLRCLATEEVSHLSIFKTEMLVESLREEIDVLYKRGLRNEQIVEELRKIGIIITPFALVRDLTRRRKAAFSAASTFPTSVPAAACAPAASVPLAVERGVPASPVIEVKSRAESTAPVALKVIENTAPPKRRASGFVPVPDTVDI